MKSVEFNHATRRGSSKGSQEKTNKKREGGGDTMTRELHNGKRSLSVIFFMFDIFTDALRTWIAVCEQSRSERKD